MDTKGEEADGLPEVEETKEKIVKKRVLHDDSDEEDDGFVHCDPDINLEEEEKEEANLNSQIPASKSKQSMKPQVLKGKAKFPKDAFESKLEDGDL